MSTQVQVTGNLGQDPEMRYLQSGKAVLNVSVGGTYSRKDQQTGEWVDVGDPLWLRAAFWEEQAERLSGLLGKGDRVTIEGVLTVRAYEKQDGTRGTSLEVQHARFLGVIPRGERRPVMAAVPAPRMEHVASPPADDGWGTGGFDQKAPF